MIVHENFSQVVIQSTLKKKDFGFCKNKIYTPQEYRESRKLRKKYKNLKKKKQEKLPKKTTEKKQWVQGRPPKPKRKFVRRSITFKKGIKNSPHLVKRPSKEKCSYFICGDPKHFANSCLNKQISHNQGIINLVQGLEEDIVSLNGDEEPYEVLSICSEIDNEPEIMALLSNGSEIFSDEEFIFMNSLTEDCTNHHWLH